MARGLVRARAAASSDVIIAALAAQVGHRKTADATPVTVRRWCVTIRTSVLFFLFMLPPRSGFGHAGDSGLAPNVAWPSHTCQH